VSVSAGGENSTPSACEHRLTSTVVPTNYVAWTVNSTISPEPYGLRSRRITSIRSWLNQGVFDPISPNPGSIELRIIGTLQLVATGVQPPLELGQPIRQPIPERQLMTAKRLP
jgi:hypothetical protein